MRISTIPVAVISICLACTLPAAAQKEEGPQEQPELPPPAEAPAAHELTVGPNCSDGCPGVNVLPVEMSRPIKVLVPREVVTPVKRPALAIEYRERKCKVTEMVLKPVEVMRKVPCTTLKPCQVTCPHTGKLTTVMKPVTEMKLQKEVVFQSVPEQREIVVKVPYYKEIEEVVPQRNVLLEWKTELQTKTFAVPVPYQALRDRYYITPGGHDCVPGHLGTADHHHH